MQPPMVLIVLIVKIFCTAKRSSCTENSKKTLPQAVFQCNFHLDNILQRFNSLAYETLFHIDVNVRLAL